MCAFPVSHLQAARGHADEEHKCLWFPDGAAGHAWCAWCTVWLRLDQQ